MLEFFSYLGMKRKLINAPNRHEDIFISGSLRKKIALIVFPLCFAVCFFLLVHGIRQEKLKEKFIDLQGYLELLSLHSNTCGDENTFFGALHGGIQFIDKLPHIFAVLYDSDLQILSNRSPEEGTAPFDPRRNKKFMELVATGTTGIIPVIWEDLEGGITKRTMYTCYRWVRVPGGNKQICLAAGVSSYSLTSPSLDLFIGIVFAILSVSLTAILWFAIFIVYDIHIRYRRTSE